MTLLRLKETDVISTKLKTLSVLPKEWSTNPTQPGGLLTLKIPRPDEGSKEFFKSILPDDPRVTVRLVFGNAAAFVNRTMFVGLWGNDLFLRLSDEDRKELLKNEGATNFEPMKGKPMKGYILIPRTWKTQPQTLRRWVARSLEWASELPAKKSKR